MFLKNFNGNKIKRNGATFTRKDSSRRLNKGARQAFKQFQLRTLGNLKKFMSLPIKYLTRKLCEVVKKL